MAASTSGNAAPYYGQTQNVGKFYNMTGTNSGELVKTGEGVLYRIIINNPTATAVITLYDGLTSSGTKLGTITVPASPQPVSLPYFVFFSTGGGGAQGTAACDLTISFR